MREKNHIRITETITLSETVSRLNVYHRLSPWKRFVFARRRNRNRRTILTPVLVFGAFDEKNDAKYASF